MATLKLNTGGSVILKNGLPSCTCCGPCSPDITLVYVEHIQFPYAGGAITSFEMSGSSNASLFTGTGPNGLCNLAYDGTQWTFHDTAYDELGGDAPFDQCHPEGLYEPTGPPYNYEVTVSTTPLP